MHKTNNHLQKLNWLEWLYCREITIHNECHSHLMVDVVNSNQNVVFEYAENDSFENILNS